MRTELIFCDDSGEYQPKGKFDVKRGRKSFYVRAALMLQSTQYATLRSRLSSARALLGLDPRIVDEVKWQHLTRARKALENGQDIKPNKEHAYLNGTSAEQINRFVEHVFESFQQLDGCKIVLTVSKSGVSTHDTKTIFTWHLQNLMQRLQMELCPRNQASDSLGIVSADKESGRQDLKQRHISNLYNQLRITGDRFFPIFANLSDAIAFVDSAHSAGVQVADFVAGCAHATLRGEQFSQELWRHYCAPALRANELGQVSQIGIVQVPSRVLEELELASLSP